MLLGCGKSTVSKRLDSLEEFVVVDCDKIARAVVEPGKAAYNKIIRSFGDAVVLENVRAVHSDLND